MDSKDFGSKNPVSVLQGDKFFFNRIISRESSVGCSSRFYYRSSEGVPFTWEKQPGKSKSPPGTEVVPPIRAPPAVLSLGLPKPRIEEQKSSTDSMASKVSRVWFWKKSKKNDRLRKKKHINNGYGRDLGRSENLEVLYNSDVEFVDSSPCSLSSSSFSSSSINGDHSLPSSRIDSPASDLVYGPFSCSPWNISAIMICIAKRV